MKKASHLAVLAISICLSSCMTSFGINFDLITGGTYEYKVPTRVENAFEGEIGPATNEGKTLAEVRLSQGKHVLPSLGKATVLVLPISFLGSSFGPSFQSDLAHALNGAAKDTQYYESVTSFYQKSSYGKSQLQFEIAPVYFTTHSPESALTSTDTSQGEDKGAYFVQQAYAKYVEGKSEEELARFDADGDGVLDAVMGVYSCRDSKLAQYANDPLQYFGAYTSWVNPDESLLMPMSCYSWLSYDYLYRYADLSSPAVDAHFFIREVGHMYGLERYGKYVGGLDNADGGTLDHNAFSKLILGWAKPIVTKGKGSLNLNASIIDGECLLLPSSASGAMNPFGEYILVEYYSPQGLNARDAGRSYDGSPKGYGRSGVKVYHVDARLEQKEYPVLHLMESGKTNTFEKDGKASDATLFANGYTFDIATFGESFFPKKTTMNNGEGFPYRIHIDSLGAASCRLSVE